MSGTAGYIGGGIVLKNDKGSLETIRTQQMVRSSILGFHK